jgi:hypothetical protein
MQESKLQLRRYPPRRSRKAVWLGCAAGVLSRLFHRRLPEPTPDDLRAHDYPTSTQRMGVRFTEPHSRHVPIPLAQANSVTTPLAIATNGMPHSIYILTQRPDSKQPVPDEECPHECGETGA